MYPSQTEPQTQDSPSGPWEHLVSSFVLSLDWGGVGKLGKGQGQGGNLRAVGTDRAFPEDPSPGREVVLPSGWEEMDSGARLSLLEFQLCPFLAESPGLGFPI